MKKAFGIILSLFLMLFPFSVFASEMEIAGIKYETQNLEELLNELKIEKAYSNYEENDDQVIVYVFRGDGCEYCDDLVRFLNNITNEYGQYFKVISFEVNKNKNNSDLLTNVADYIGADNPGIPFIIIGNKYYEGYNSEYDQMIKNAIMESYNTPKDDRADIIKGVVSKNSKTTPKKIIDTDTKIIAWNFLFTVFSTIIILVFVNYKIGKLDDKVSYINNKGKH